MGDEPGAYRVMKLNSPVGKPGPQSLQIGSTTYKIQEKTHAMSRQLAIGHFNPAATAEWLNAQPSSPDNDPAIASFIQNPVDPQVQWVGQPPYQIPACGKNPSNRQSMPGSRPILKKLIFG